MMGFFAKQSNVRGFQQALAYVLLILGAVVMFTPFLWVISTALKTASQVAAWPPVWVPSPIRWQNFTEFWNSAPVAGGFLRFTGNTLFITLVCMVGQAGSALVVAYGFARYRFPGRDALFLVLLSTMMLPGAVTLIPQFVMYQSLGWLDTFLPLTVSSFFGGGAFFIFLARQFFLTIPQELEEAARLDGCSGWQTFWHIFLPLSKPVLATIAIFSFTGHWKEFMGPLIYLNSQENYTLTLGLSWFKQSIGGMAGGETPYHLLMAATIVVVLPLIAIFFAAQKQFTEGIAMTGSKE